MLPPRLREALSVSIESRTDAIAAYPNTAIIVLNWNGRDDTVRCVASLRAAAPAATIVVVDNGSQDGSVDALRLRYPGLEIIETHENLGYAGGNNRGLSWALAANFDVIGVLNNDTVVGERFLNPLLDEIVQDPQRVVASPAIYYLGRPGVWFAGSSFDARRGIYVHRSVDVVPAETTETPAITGCAIFAHRDVWTRVGLFDESFFLIFEDADWSERAIKFGMRLVVVGRSRIEHAVSASFDRESSDVGLPYYARNGIRHLRRERRTTSQKIQFSTWCLRQSFRGCRGDWWRGMKRALVTTRALIDGFAGRGGKAGLRTWVGGGE